LRESGTPYHLAHGLLDQAEHLARQADEAASLAVEEARRIADRLRCQPLLDRIEAMKTPQPRTTAARRRLLTK
jgi:hypothetical protein